MTLGFIDANIIIRYATQDDPTLAKKAKAILKRVKRRLSLG